MRLALLFSFLVLFVGCSLDQPGTNNGSPMGVGDPDDPNGALQWQIDRLKDPATGNIPAGIRKAELAFAKTLPKRTGAKSLAWQWRGPRNRGGRTRALGIDRRDPQVILAGGVTGGMWRSTDDGQSWTQTTDPGTLQSVSSIVQDPRPGKGDTWYYGTGENYGVVSGTSFSALLAGNGIFKSNDNGQSWTQLQSTVGADPEEYTRNGSFKQVNRIVIDPNDTVNDVVLAAVYNGVFRSIDGGTSWTDVLGVDSSGTTRSTYTEVVVSASGVFYASLGNSSPSEGVYRSDDGVNWVSISPGVSYPSSKERTVIAIDPSNENVSYWFTQSPNTGTNGHQLWKYTYLSGDGSGAGGSWQNLSSSLPNGTCTGYFTFDFAPINSQSSYDMCIAVHPTDTNIVYIGGTNIYRSTNAFATADSTKWIGGYRCNQIDPKDYVYPNHHPDQHYMLFAPNDPDRLYSASDGGVALCANALADSVQWTDLNTGYITSQFYTVHMEQGNSTSDMLLGGTQDNGCWLALDANLNSDWSQVHPDDGAYCAIPEGQNFILTSSQLGRLYKKTIDASGNVTSFERIDPNFALSTYNFINQFILDPLDNNQLYWVSGNRVLRNTDLAGIPITDNWYDDINTNWELLPEAVLPASQRITTLDIPLSGRTLYVGSRNGKVHRIDSLDQFPMTRTEITTTDFPLFAYVSCIEANDNDPDELLVTFSNYEVQSIWHSTDRGDTWMHVGGNLEENNDGSGSGPAVFWGTIYPTYDGVSNQYFVGTSTGLYSTDLLDGDNTVWVQEGPNSIGNVPINMIALRHSDGTIAVATHGHGVYSSGLPPAPIGVEENGGQADLQVWPIPATDHLRVSGTITNDGPLMIELIDMQGRVVLQRTIPTNTGSINEQLDLPGTIAAGSHVIRVVGDNDILFNKNIQIQ